MNSLIDENSQNMSQDAIRKKGRGKENQSLNRNSIKYSSFTSVIEKAQPFQHLKLPNGQYWGQLKLGKAEGVGSCQFPKGGFYYGEWKNNIIHGIGIYFFNIGGYIKGEFKDGRADGNCELHYQNGQQFQGYFREGKQHGVGLKIGRRGKEVVQYKEGTRVCLTEEPQIIENVYTHNDRTVYGLQCDLTGLGAIAYANGRVDTGWFQNGSLNGRGRIIFKSGDIYDGLLKNGFFQGAGFYLNYNSKQLTEGTFEKNQIVSINQQVIQYPPGGDDDYTIVEPRIIIKNVHLKIRAVNLNRGCSSDKKPTKVNKIQNLIQHMLYPVRKTQHSQKSESGQHEEVLDNLLSLVQSPQQRKNLEQIISQVTSPQRIR